VTARRRSQVACAKGAWLTTVPTAAALGFDTVIGFTGSPSLAPVAMFSPSAYSTIEAGYAEFAARSTDPRRLRSVGSASPTRSIPRDSPTLVPSAPLEAIGNRPPSPHFVPPATSSWPDLDPVGFLSAFRDRIYHSTQGRGEAAHGPNGRLGSHLRGATPAGGLDSSPPAR